MVERRYKLQLGERRLLGKRCWHLAMKRQKKDVWKRTEKKRKKAKRCIYRSKKKLNEQSERRINVDVNRNRKLFGRG